MESFFSRFRNPLFLIALLLAQTIGLAVQVRREPDPQHADAPKVRLIRLWSMAIFTPVERMATGTGHGIGGAWANYLDLRHVRQHNKDLEQQLALLRIQQGAIAEDALEGQRLKKLMGFQQQYVEKTVAAQVIGTSGSEQMRTLMLDKGSADGLKTDMAVITPDGIVGKLRDVFSHTSELLLINDQQSGAGVVLQSSRIRAVIHGTSTGRVVITDLTPDSRIKPGETIVTSGGDQVFPRGLAVGRIVSVAPNPEHQPFTLITVQPAANLFQLDEVLVVTSVGASLLPAAQQELAADQAAQSAVINAQRLPSLHEAGDPNAPATADPPPDNSTELVPKPKPALHPDKYSPGSAPPAEVLKPGASVSPTAVPPPAEPPKTAPASSGTEPPTTDTSS
jgi:rod shape-determining protein MreC